MRALVLGLSVTIVGLSSAAPAAAQAVGTFRWQLAPYCNVVTLTVVQQGASFVLNGFDNQCGGPQSAAVSGTAHINPNGTVGLGLIVIQSDGLSIPGAAIVNLSSGAGTWSDHFGNGGTFTPVAGAAAGGPARPTIQRARSGQVLAGVLSGNAAPNAGYFELAASFPLPLPTATPPLVLNYRPDGSTDAACPGIGQAAVAGTVCVYGYNTRNILTGSVILLNGGSSRLYGFAMEAHSEFLDSDSYLLASWAYRVP